MEGNRQPRDTGMKCSGARARRLSAGHSVQRLALANLAYKTPQRLVNVSGQYLRRMQELRGILHCCLSDSDVLQRLEAPLQVSQLHTGDTGQEQHLRLLSLEHRIDLLAKIRVASLQCFESLFY